jgi:hypothetical protein
MGEDTKHFEDPKRWSIDQVFSFVYDRGLAAAATILKREEVDGEVLLDLTREKLVEKPYQLSGGAAEKLAKAINELKEGIKFN